MALRLCLLSLIFFMGVSAQDKIYKMCVTDTQATSNDCQILKRSGSKFNCVNVKDSTDCALKLQRGDADFGIFTADEAILMSKFDTRQERKVLAEIRNTERSNSNFNFETVVIIRGTFNGPLKNLKGKKFCHPGFSKSQIWSDRILKHFERVVLNTTVKCDRSLRSTVESELHALSSFFSSSCRPGDWVPSDYSALDKKFKRSQYKNLCSLCDSRSGCSYNPQADGNQYSTLDCLTKRGGDIAYVSNYYARLYFGKEIIKGIIHREIVNPDQYNYLCPDGTTQSLSKTDPCTWIAQPWDSVIARNELTASGLSTELQKYLPTEQLKSSRDEWVDTLIKIVVGQDKKLFMKNRIFKLSEYIQAGREIPVAGTTVPCVLPIKWCTISNKETEKCEWLKEAGITQGIVPELKCIKGSSKIDCLEKLKNGDADITGIETNLGTVANQYYNLSTVLYQEIEKEANSKIVAIVKNGVTATSINDFKYKKACFPEFGGLAWTAVSQVIDDSENDYCPYDKTLGDFFSEVCAPGAKIRLEANTTVDTKFCKLCREAFSEDKRKMPFTKEESCSAMNKNGFYGDVGALQCLSTGVADVAFINAYNLSSLLENGILPEDFSQQYSILCKNGNKIQLSDTIDEECAITIVTGGELIARKSSTNMELRDLGITLETYADSFGYFSRHYLSIFHMFDPFDGVKDLLFKNEALQFVTIHDRNDDPYVAMKTYSELINKAEKCGHRKSAAEAIEVKISSVIFMVIATVLQIVLMF